MGTPSTFRRLLAAGVGALVLTSGAVVATASSAPAGSTPAAVAPARPAEPEAAKQAVGISYPGGPGHPGPVWAGTWDNGERGFCIDFTKHSPNNSGTTTITGAIPGMTARQSARIKQIANAYAKTTSPKQAAQAQLAVWVVEAAPEFTRWYAASGVTKADRKGVAEIVRETLAGPVRIAVRAAKVQVGQRGAGTVAALDAPAAAAGLPVEVRATGATIRSVNGAPGAKGRMTAKGLTFTYERTAPGKVDLRAILSAPSRLRGGLSVTEGNHQRTLSGGQFETAEATFGYLLTAGQPTITTACSTDCDGVADLVVKACNPAGADTIRWTQRAGDKVLTALAVPAGKCGTAKGKAADGMLVASEYCYAAAAAGDCTTSATTLSKRYEVVCPPWVQATYELTCNCPGAGGGTVTFTAPVQSTRFYRGLVTVTPSGGKARQLRADLLNGTPATVELPVLPKGGQVVVGFTTYRDAARAKPIGKQQVLTKVSVADTA